MGPHPPVLIDGHAMERANQTSSGSRQSSDSTVMALAGHVSRAMMERYSHIRMEAKRRAGTTSVARILS